jgi:hypothetical protein
LIIKRFTLLCFLFRDHGICTRILLLRLFILVFRGLFLRRSCLNGLFFFVLLVLVLALLFLVVIVIIVFMIPREG